MSHKRKLQKQIMEKKRLQSSGLRFKMMVILIFMGFYRGYGIRVRHATGYRCDQGSTNRKVGPRGPRDPFRSKDFPFTITFKV